MFKGQMSKSRMAKQEMAREIASSGAALSKSIGNLVHWFERQKRVLPWRDRPEPYRVWISEVMLQQTQVATVIPYFERFVKRFPDVKTLAAAPEQEVLLHWAGLGYYSRARNIQKAARQIVEWGQFPKTREQWLELPGIGQYTAGAILSIALNQPVPILDGNIERVFSRLRRVERDSPLGFKNRLWRLSRIFVERAAELGHAPRDLNQALMELGATVCTPRRPRCESCPLVAVCRASQRGEPEAFPRPKPPKEWIQVREKLHLWTDGKGRVLLQQRNSGEWRAGLWDLLEKAPETSHWAQAGKVKTQHIVTRHRITRETALWVKKGRAPKASLKDSKGGMWVLARDPQVPAGSALQKTLKAAIKMFPDFFPASG